MIEELPFGDPLRSALETSVLGGMARLSFDTAGRITLPESLCQEFGIEDWVAVVGMGERFQIWELNAFRAHRSAQRTAAWAFDAASCVSSGIGALHCRFHASVFF